MIRTTLFPALLLCALASSAPAAIISNVLADPQFNTGGLPWTKGETGMIVQFFSDVSQDYGAEHDDGSGTDGFAKILDNSITQPNFGLILSPYHSAAPGEVWEGQAWARDEHGTSLEPDDEVAIKVAFFNSGIGFLSQETGYVTPTDTWTQFAPLAATAPAGTAYVQLQLAYASDPLDSNSTGFVLFDTASLGIQTVPEPATLPMALLCLGMVAVAGGWSRVRVPRGQHQLRGQAS